MRRKIAMVVQRYGLEVNGGAELHCRQLAEHLSKNHDIEIITTKAIDYVTWKNEYKNDVDIVNGLTVHRFGVEHERNTSKFDKLSAKVIGAKHDDDLEEKWIDEQGPYCPSLISFIEENEDKYDLFIFMTYLYYTTARGLLKVKDKAIMIPTAHDEPPIYLDYFNKVFKAPKGIFYNTVDEKNFIERKFGVANIPNNDGFGGVGVETPESVDPEFLSKTKNISNYMVYVGRIDESKGCGELFNFYERYKKENDNDLKLVLVGKPVMKIPKDSDIISLGFVTDQEKFDVISGAKFLVLPSEFESLSMVVLEALSLNIPVLVNGRCKVLKSHCTKGNAGLYYKNYYEFAESINYYRSHENERKIIGSQGSQYVETYYKWDKIIDRLNTLIDEVLK